MALNTKISDVTVHCSATPPDMAVDVRVISGMHALRGFISPGPGEPICGYHWVIHRDGTIEKGRSEQFVGAHVEGHNTGNLGVCLAGGVDKKNNPQNNYTDDQWLSLVVVLKDMQSRHGHVTIRGHKDWPQVAKACPCFDVSAWLKTVGL